MVKGLDQISHAMGEAGVAATTIRNLLAERRRSGAKAYSANSAATTTSALGIPFGHRLGRASGP